MLEFIIPLYEQSKFEEQKDLPILKVIDRAVPPIQRSYPQRVFSAAVISFIVTVFACIIILLRELFRNSTNEKVLYLRRELSFFGRKK
jgi:uncharacterized protein involved in exopolysaccharide biosynthesis